MRAPIVYYALDLTEEAIWEIFGESYKQLMTPNLMLKSYNGGNYNIGLRNWCSIPYHGSFGPLKESVFSSSLGLLLALCAQTCKKNVKVFLAWFSRSVFSMEAALIPHGT